MAGIAFFCSQCRQNLEAPEELKGQQVQCPGCNASIIVPALRATAKPIDPSPRMKECPYCSEQIMATAKKCKHCGETIDVALRSAEEAKRNNGIQMVNINERRNVVVPDDSLNSNSGLVTGGWITAFLFPFVGVIIGIMLLVKGNRIGHAIGILCTSLFMFMFWIGFWPAFFSALG
jgi:DNA-directed RNA polymerase subunit RPC12/RpoP